MATLPSRWVKIGVAIGELTRRVCPLPVARFHRASGGTHLNLIGGLQAKDYRLKWADSRRFGSKASTHESGSELQHSKAPAANEQARRRRAKDRPTAHPAACERD